MAAWMIPAAIMASSYLGGKAAERGGREQAKATERAAQLERQTAQEQLALQTRMYEEDISRQKPFYDVGVNALPELVNASRYTNFGMDQFQADPGYAFRLGEGQKALERSAAARGGLLSGGTGKALQRFGQEFGSQEYTNAFNRYQAERDARLRPLQSLTGMGQTTSQQLGASGQNYAGSSANIAGNMASNVGNLMGSGAAARASGYVGTANALTSGLGTYLNYQQGQSMVNALQNRGGGYGGGYTPTTDYSTGANYELGLR
jgi:hypothetical protein